MDVEDVKESEKIIHGLEKEHGAQLKYILSTHRHADHVDGNEYWSRERPDVTILGSEKGLG